MSNISIGKRMALAFGAICVLIVLLVLTTLWGLNNQSQARETVAVENALNQQIAEIEFKATQMSAFATDYMFEAALDDAAQATDDTKGARKEFLDAYAAFKTAIADTGPMTADDPGEQRTIKGVEDSVNAYVGVINQATALYRENSPDSIKAANITAHSPEADSMGDIVAGIEAFHEKTVQAAADADTDAESASNLTTALVIGVGLLALVLAGLLALLLTRSVTKPLQNAVRVLRRVATGDLSARLASHSRDEIGQMGLALDEALDRMSETISGIDRSAATLSASSEELSSLARQLSASSEEAASQAVSVSAAAEQVSQNVQSVASASEELGASEDEIARSTHAAVEVAGHAVTAAQSATATVGKLGASSTEIGEVVKVITSIAEQINLLALNATIEAARAGEVGKSFAVVANEVKDLARKTARSSDEIGRKIVSMQTNTQDAVAAIGEITVVIEKINEMQIVVAASVEEQTAATSEIGRSVTEAAAGSSEIARTITDVAAAARDATQAATDTQRSAEDLARLAAELTTLVGQFRLSDRR